MSTTSVSFSVRSVAGDSYVQSDKAVLLGYTVHAGIHGIVSSADAMLTLAEARELIKEIQESIAEAEVVLDEMMFGVKA